MLIDLFLIQLLTFKFVKSSDILFYNTVEIISCTPDHRRNVFALGLVYSAAKYYCSCWFNSTHANKIDVKLNEAQCVELLGRLNRLPFNGYLHSVISLQQLGDKRHCCVDIKKCSITHPCLCTLHHDWRDPPIPRWISSKPLVVYAKRLLESEFDPQSSWQVLSTQSGISNPLFICIRNLLQSPTRRHATKKGCSMAEAIRPVI